MKYFHFFIIYFFGTFSYFIALVKNDNHGRIIGGMYADRDVWTFMVKVIFRHPNPGRGRACGGSILDACYILTAAHCV